MKVGPGHFLDQTVGRPFAKQINRADHNAPTHSAIPTGPVVTHGPTSRAGPEIRKPDPKRASLSLSEGL